MTNINQSPTGMNGNSIESSMPTLSLQHQQAWLHALEKTGLNDALLKAKVFSTTGKNPVDLTSEQPTTDAGAPSEAENIELYQRANTTLSKSGQEDSGSENNHQLFPITSSIETLSGLISIGQQAQGTIKLPNTQIFDFLSKSSYFALAWKYLQYPVRNMAMTNLGVETELWVRDATLSEAKLMEILTGVRQSMGALGISLAKVVLNGQTVFSSQESGEEISHLKEV